MNPESFSEHVFEISPLVEDAAQSFPSRGLSVDAISVSCTFVCRHTKSHGLRQTSADHHLECNQVIRYGLYLP